MSLLKTEEGPQGGDLAWISVKDDLPVSNSYVLAWDGVSMEVCYFIVPTKGGQHWTICDGEYGFLTTHWQNTPEPPKETT